MERDSSRAKRLLDILLSSTGLLISSPVWAIAAAAVKLYDGGAVFYGQDRVGRDGRIFRAWKFRSMREDAEAAGQAVAAVSQDPRVTPVGRVLRATAMDELPQLWNILRGEMSFVGPRALRPGEVEPGSAGHEVALEKIPGFELRCRVRPGLTGIAQIYASRDLPRRQKFRYDRVYLRRQSFWLDVRLILLSFWITARGAWEARGPKL